jgi:hypothetical protein
MFSTGVSTDFVTDCASAFRAANDIPAATAEPRKARRLCVMKDAYRGAEETGDSTLFHRAFAWIRTFGNW